MAYNIIGEFFSDGNLYVMDIVCDTDGDVSTLPTSQSKPRGAAAGSRAFICENGNIYVLNSKDEWVNPFSTGA